MIRAIAHRPSRRAATVLAALCVFLASGSIARAQFFSETNHPELSWHVIETEHFRFTYHEGLETFARRVAAAAEDVYGPITDLYGYEPDGKPRILIRDIDDANMSAYYPGTNTIDFWATSITHNFELRGAKTDWVRNIFTHEFTHLVSTHTARKTASRIQGLYLQAFAYQAEDRREDVTTGFPDLLSSVVLPSEIVPPWFTEGTAQYMARGVRFDRWESHRDMIVRQAVLNDRLLTYDEMCNFGAKSGLGFEKVYDHGYALTLYIVNRFGEERLRDLYRAMQPPWRIDFNGAVEQALGISDRELYDGWRASLEERYRLQKAELEPHLAEGDLLADDGYMNLYPRWSPDGKHLAYLSNAGGDYGRTNLFVMTLSDTSKEMAAPGARTAFDWHADGRHMLFSRLSRPDEHGSRYWDVYTVDRDDSTGVGPFRHLRSTVGFGGGLPPGEERLTHGARAVYPRYSPDGASVAFVRNGRGMNNLALLDVASGDIRDLTHFDDGTQIYTPAWSPDGSRIAFSIFTADGDRSIAILDPANNTWRYLVRSAGTDRDPCWTADGEGLVFASDHDGIFNLYHVDVGTGAVHRITRVLGGALMPDVRAEDGRIAFTHYGASGYEIRAIDAKGAWEPVEGIFETYTDPVVSPVATLDDVASRPYKGSFMGLLVAPRVAFDVGKLKVGFYANSFEALGKQSLFLSGLVSHDRDLELFGIYEYKGWKPTFYVQAFRVTHHVEEDIVDRDLDTRIYNRTFALNGVSLGLRRQLGGGGTLDAHVEYDRFGNAIDGSRFNGSGRGSVGATFLNGFDLALSYRYNSVPPGIASEVSPSAGRDIDLRYDRYFNFFLKDFQENTTIVIEEFQNFFYHQVALDWNEHLNGPGPTSIGLRFYGGWMNGSVNHPDANDYFDFHIGGLPYMKGYTFFTLEGSRAAMFRGAWRFPLWRNIARQTGPVYSDQLYGVIYGGIGRAWDGTPEDDLFNRGWKKDVGFQFRYEGTSFYQYPLRVSFDVAYGLDTVPIFEAGEPLEKGGLKFYGTVLFGFLPGVGAH